MLTWSILLNLHLLEKLKSRYVISVILLLDYVAQPQAGKLQAMHNIHPLSTSVMLVTLERLSQLRWL